jgi:hypothetical protein
MTRFVLAFTGGEGMPESEAEQAEIMQAWGAWFEQLGDAVDDGGNPFSISKTISPSGDVSDGGSAGLTGFTVLGAETIDAAVDLAKGCPVLAGGGSIDVYEALDM